MEVPGLLIHAGETTPNLLASVERRHDLADRYIVLEVVIEDELDHPAEG